MRFSEQFDQTEKTGYLNEEFRLFHIKDQTNKEFPYHYHDFHKVVIFISGKAAYHIEGKVYQLKPWDILLVSRHSIHRPEIDPSVPYERFILWIQNDLPWQELLKCFQKANDRSYNLVRLHSALQEKMRDILFGTEQYPYLLPNAAARLENARRTAAAVGMRQRPVVSLGGSSFVFFPWLGTRPFRTMRRLLTHFAQSLGISEIRGEGCCYLTFRAEPERGKMLIPALRSLLSACPVEPASLVGESECPMFEKYDRFIPAELLRSAYVSDRLDLPGCLLRLDSFRTRDEKPLF